MPSLVEKLQNEHNANVMTLLYREIDKLFGAGNQLFAMEFPARSLSSRTYTYQVDDSYSVLTKPYPVQEAEFALSDQMFDVSPIVQGSNGEKLSAVYTTLINNLVPKLSELKPFVHDQKGLREWLMTKVTDNIDGEKVEMTRMAMAKTLYAKFLDKRNEWYHEKTLQYDKAKAANDLDSYSKWLSSEGLVREEEINNLYNDAVVRGNYHEVLTLLGFLNVSSTAETLETTKQKMRSSLRRSLDASSDVYPVQFQPADWFKALRPNLSPKDLTMATDVLIDEYKTKKARIRRLQSQLAQCEVIEISPEESKILEEAAKEAKAAASQSELEMVSQYGSSAVSAVKAVLAIFENSEDPHKEAGRASKDGNNKEVAAILGGIAQTSIDELIEGFRKQAALVDKLQQANEAKMLFAESKVKDMRLQKLRIEEEIANIQADLDFITPLVSGVLNPENNVPVDETKLLTDSAEGGEDNNFTDIILKRSSSASQSSSTTKSSSSSSSWRVGLWFASGGGSTSSASSEHKDESMTLSQDIEIGMRVKKVSIERGGWFNPTIFKLSKNYYRLSDVQFSKGITKEDIANVILNGTPINSLTTYGPDNKYTYILPAFTTGFVIAKDITIKIKSSSEESKHNSEYMEKSSASGGGLFCFSASSSSSSKSTSESAYFGSSANYFYIRIPGPQIIGWFLQFTPNDASEEYQMLEEGLYDSALAKFSQEEKEVANP